jgi:hypothetical protein
MATISDIEKVALGLPETDRASLATALLKSLSPILEDPDEGVAEALRRDAELDAAPQSAIGLEELDRKVAARRRCD